MLARTCLDLPRLALRLAQTAPLLLTTAHSSRDLPTLAETCRDLPRLARTSIDLPRLPHSCSLLHTPAHYSTLLSTLAHNTTTTTNNNKTKARPFAAQRAHAPCGGKKNSRDSRQMSNFVGIIDINKTTVYQFFLHNRTIPNFVQIEGAEMKTERKKS
jgi:hypothetical protein